MHYLITIYPNTRRAKPIVLGDDKNGWKVAIDHGMPKPVRAPRIHRLFRAAHPAIYDNFNTYSEYGFVVDRQFGSAAELLSFKTFTLQDIVPNVGTLVVENSNGFKGKLMNCAITPEPVRDDGVSLVIHYACVGTHWD